MSAGSVVRSLMSNDECSLELNGPTCKIIEQIVPESADRLGCHPETPKAR